MAIHCGGRPALDAGHAVLGVVENVSGELPRPFGAGGGEWAARALAVPLLARIGLGGPTLPGSGPFHPCSEAGRRFANLVGEVARVSVAVG